MAEAIPMGRRTLFLPLNPERIAAVGDGAELICVADDITTVIRFPEAMIANLPDDTCCATVIGDATLELRVNESAFVEGVELVLAEEIDVFADLPTEGRDAEVIPF